MGANMKRLLLPLAALAIVGLLLSSGSRRAYGCWCVPLTPQEYADSADVIIIGTVSKQFKETFIIAPERYLKGGGPSEIRVRDAAFGSDCGVLPYDLASQRYRYLLFLTEATGAQNSQLETSQCTGTVFLSGQQHATDFLENVQARTGPGVPPQEAPPASETNGDGGFPWLPVVIASTASAGALGAAAAWLLQHASRV